MTEVDGWRENDAAGGGLLPWRELWGARELVLMFAQRDLRVRYKQAAFGAAWVLVQPVLTVVAFTLAFDRLADVDTDGVVYPVFALAGLLAWTYVTSCVTRGSEVLVSNTALVTKVYFPRLTAPLAALLPPLVDLLIGLLLLGVLLVAYGVTPGPQVLLLPVWLALLLLTSFGVVCLLAAVNVRFRDVRQLVAPVLQVLLFLSPVAYSASSLSDREHLLYSLNPFVGVLELGRWVLVDGPAPGLSLLVSVGTATLLCIGGLVYFQSAQRSFADVI